MYRALYRSYRPQTFSEVYGQPYVTDTLKNELRENRIFHAYLFTGSRGTGKTSCAKILAKAVNCLAPEDGNPCLKCENCLGIEDGDFLDVVEIDAASNNGVNNIRDLREQAAFTPSKGKYRVYIIDEVHMLSTGAFNALLKTLEEPPSHVVFILATTEVHKLPATILSRCQRFDFKRIDIEEICKRIDYIAEKEGFTVEPAAAQLIASLADGAMRDALSILDLCTGHSHNITEELVAKICGMAGKKHLAEMAAFLQGGDIGSALTLSDQLHCNSIDMQRLCEELLSYYRDLMIIKTVTNSKKLIVCSSDDFELLKTAAANFTTGDILYAMSEFETALSKMGRGNRRFELELALIRICSKKASISYSAVKETPILVESPVVKAPVVKGSKPKVIASVDTVEDFNQIPPVTDFENGTPFETPTEIGHNGDETPPPAPQKAINTSTDKEGKLALWPEVLDALSKNCPLLLGVLKGSTAYVKKDFLLIDSPNSQFRDMVKGENPLYRDQIRIAAETVTGRVFKLGPYPRKTTDEKKAADPFAELVDRLKDLEVPKTNI